MKATIDFDEHLYRRLKVEAARRGRTVRELVAEGVRYVLDGEQPAAGVPDAGAASEWRPSWIGMLRPWAANAPDHSMDAIRTSIARGRASEEAP
jgi:hypothetical protein